MPSSGARLAISLALYLASYTYESSSYIYLSAEEAYPTATAIIVYLIYDMIQTSERKREQC